MIHPVPRSPRALLLPLLVPLFSATSVCVTSNYPASASAASTSATSIYLPHAVVVATPSAPTTATALQVAAAITPPRKGKPSGTKGGGSRPTENACFRSAALRQTTPTALAALSPISYSAENPVGRTSRDRPIFTVYTPTTIAQHIEFSLLDDQGNGIFQTTFPVPRQSRFLRIPLPATVPPLKIGSTYQWSVVLICNPRDRTEDWVTQSTIQRIALEPWLKQKLAQSSPLERLDLYRNHDLWYDAIAAAMELHQANPTHAMLAQRWSELLQIAGFNALDQPHPPITTLKQ
jgi:hypothetical protein